MSWENIDNQKPVKASACPALGVMVKCKHAKARGVPVSYIAVQIGAVLARSLSLVPEEVKVRLLFGSGSDAGKIAISVDHQGGGFTARRLKDGRYQLTINARTADGRFSLDFPEFSVDRLEVVRGEGKPPMTVFRASKDMLAVDGADR